jgi:hypothetical protein
MCGSPVGLPEVENGVSVDALPTVGGCESGELHVGFAGVSDDGPHVSVNSAVVGGLLVPGFPGGHELLAQEAIGVEVDRFEVVISWR